MNDAKCAPLKLSNPAKLSHAIGHISAHGAIMEPAEYETMYQCEDAYWWYVGLRDLILSQIARFSRGRRNLSILDAGCGTGKLLEVLNAFRAYGVEFSSAALPFLRRRGLNSIVQASVCKIPFPDNRFDVVISMDVIYDVEAPGDQIALQEMSRVLKPGGMLLLNVPAYEFLRSRHDAAIHTKQRYTRARLREMVRQAKLRVKMITYRNTFLFPFAASVRLAQRLCRQPTTVRQSDLRPLPGLLNRALTQLLFVENRLLHCGLRFPFGLSIYGWATKEDEEGRQ